MRLLLSSFLLFLAGCGLLGSPTLDFNQLTGTMTEAEAQALQPHLDWQCNADDPANGGRFGQRVCDGLTDELNGLPATRVDYLFRDGTLSFAIVEYSPDGFEALAKQWDEKHGRRGESEAPGAVRGMFRGKMISWRTKEGILLSSATEKKPNGNVFALWISDKELARSVARLGY